MSDRIPDMTEPAPEPAQAVTALREPSEDEAYRQGHWAYCFGYQIDDYPYPPPHFAYQTWIFGWKNGREGDEG